MSAQADTALKMFVTSHCPASPRLTPAARHRPHTDVLTDETLLDEMWRLGLSASSSAVIDAMFELHTHAAPLSPVAFEAFSSFVPGGMVRFLCRAYLSLGAGTAHSCDMMFVRSSLMRLTNPSFGGGRWTTRADIVAPTDTTPESWSCHMVQLQGLVEIIETLDAAPGAFDVFDVLSADQGASDMADLVGFARAAVDVTDTTTR